MRTKSPILGLTLAVVLSVLVVGPAAAQDPAATITVGDNFFDPAETTVSQGDTVRWDWAGNRNHTVVADDGSFNSGTPQSTGTFEFAFDTPGTYEYFCSIHSSASGTNQNGTITVLADGGPGPDEPVEEPTDAPPPGQIQTVDGTDPVETALAYSALLPDGSTANALIGTTSTFADSLASGALQGQLSAPLLLTPTDSLDPRVASELDRLQVDNVTILGGISAINQDVEDQLAGMVSNVTRAGGDTRLETARVIADQTYPDSDIPTVIVARAFGEDSVAGGDSAAFADALASGAAAARNVFPIVLTPTDSLDPDLAAWMTQNGVQTAYIAGGTAAIDQGTEDAIQDLGITTLRLSGGSRVTTAVAITTQLADPDAPVTVVSGEGDLAWASGFSAALSSLGGILLTTGPQPPADTLLTLYGRRGIRCGPTLTDDLCGQLDSASFVDPNVAPQLIAVMDADQEVPPNDSRSSGTMAILAAGPQSVCFEASLDSLSGPITAAHIHEAPFGQAADPVIPFGLSLSELVPGLRLGCVGSAERGALSRLFTTPGGFYVNVHTEANPGGEVRGQVFDPQGVTTTSLTGDAEVPGPGDPLAVGFAVAWDTGVAGELCYTVNQGGLSPSATAGHIHRGGVTESGPVVVPLAITAESNNQTSHCDRGLDAALVDEINADPISFYVNLHNPDFPDGAIRGNLFPENRD